MKRKIITTKDGSKTIHIEEWNEQYHSVHGAINEANHVFIKHGLLHFFDTNSKTTNAEISILEIGLGTGLNAFLTALKTQEKNIKVDYVGVEAYPVKPEEVAELNYVSLIDDTQQELFDTIHQIKWEIPNDITSNFKLTKQQKFFADINAKNKFDIIYFDAFGARVQPELWSKDIFSLMYAALKNKGVLVTYASIGRVKRLMIELGFTVERLEGPPGKRHMYRATKCC